MAASHAATNLLLADLRRIFGDRLLSVAIYGSHAEGDGHGEPATCLALVRSLPAADLESCARAAAAWHRAGLATPLILPDQEFRASLDAFPLEYAEMQRAHACMYGAEPFADVNIAQHDVRRACETQVKSHLVHLREGYIEAEGKPREIAELLRSSAAAFSALLRNVARLHGTTGGDRTATTMAGARVAGLQDAVVTAVLALETADVVGATDPARLFPDYLAAIEQLAAFVDAWKA